MAKSPSAPVAQSVVIGEGGIVAYLKIETTEFPDPENNPAMVTNHVGMYISGIFGEQLISDPPFSWLTTTAPNANRSALKQAVRDHVANTFVLDVPTSAIKILSVPE